MNYGIVRRRKRWQYCHVAVLLLLAIGLGACQKSDEAKVSETGSERSFETQNADIPSDIKNAISTYHRLWQNVSADAFVSADDISLQGRLLAALDMAGFIAVDADNRLNMVRYEELLSFISSVENQNDDEILLFRIVAGGNVHLEKFSTAGGKVNVSHYYWVEDTARTDEDVLPVLGGQEDYEAYTFSYTDEGYLFVEQYRDLSYDGASGHTAIRVLPLNEETKKLNRDYISKIDYATNNLFITDWNIENDEGLSELDLSDAFEKFYPLCFDEPFPYLSDENVAIGVRYRIAADEFESVLRAYLPLTMDTIRANAEYDAATETYEFRPRVLYDAEPPNVPYPEVREFQNNADGTLTLTVAAVHPSMNLATAFLHKVVVKIDEENGDFQILSNRALIS